MKKIIIQIIVMLALLWGCSQKVTKSTRVEATTSCEPKTVIVGIDISGSYKDIFDKALSILVSFFEKNSCPGDKWYFRLIKENSFTDDAAIQVKSTFCVELPALPIPPSNPFDRIKKQSYNSALQKFLQFRNEVSNELRGLKFKPASQTDIWGFLSKASILMKSASNPYIIILSDMKDTQKREIALALKGKIIIIALKADNDPAVHFKRMEEWTQKLKATGVRDVKFKDLSEPIGREL